jgi:hypothetical protein
MENIEATHFHKLYGKRRQRIAYQRRDFLDYVLMISLCAALLCCGYGLSNPLSIAGLALCAYMIAAFPVRHGIQLRVPIILSRPQDALHSLIYKVQNIRLPYFVALGVLAVENVIIFLTPGLPHHVELTHKVALYLFYSHFILICAYRTAILISHLYNKARVREILMQTSWKQHLYRQPSIVLEILHAYFTGLLTHLVYLVPWYLVITHLNFSMVLLPVTCLAAVLMQRYSVKTLSRWFYRDHWVGHNSEFDFVYLHGTHHDAIPSGLIAVAGNGYFEGFFRGALAFPIPFYNPLMAAIVYTLDVKIDIDFHQYIPGVFPNIARGFYEATHHSTHHFGRIEPYGFGIKVDQPNVSEQTQKLFKVLPDELKYSLELDEQLTGYQWDNPHHRWFLDLVDRYQGEAVAPAAQAVHVD